MKRNVIAILSFFLLTFILSGCQSATQKAVGTLPDINDGETAVNGTIDSTNNTTLPENVDLNKLTQACKDAYAAHIRDWNGPGAKLTGDAPDIENYTSFYLVNIDSDGIPELYIDFRNANPSMYSISSEICSFDGQKTQSCELADVGPISEEGTLFVIPGSGRVLQYGVNQGNKIHRIMQISNGNVEILAYGWCVDPDAVRSTGMSPSAEYYSWMDETVGRDSYMQNLSDLFDQSKAVPVVKYAEEYTYAEIMDLLSEGSKLNDNYDLMYSDIIDTYSHAALSGYSGDVYNSTHEQVLSPGIHYVQGRQLEFYTGDINSDGIPELYVMMPVEYGSQTMLALHTVRNGTVKYVCGSDLGKENWHLCNNGVVCQSSQYFFPDSSSFVSNYYELISNSSLLQEVAYICETRDAEGTKYYTHKSANSPDYEITESEAERIIAAYPDFIVNTPSDSVPSDGYYILPGSDQWYLSEEDLWALSWEECTLARNEIYARHGRIFSTPAIASYFDAQSWYHGTVPAASFNDTVLSDIEKANIRLISDYEVSNWGGSYYSANK